MTLARLLPLRQLPRQAESDARIYRAKRDEGPVKEATGSEPSDLTHRWHLNRRDVPSSCSPGAVPQARAPGEPCCAVAGPAAFIVATPCVSFAAVIVRRRSRSGFRCAAGSTES